MSLVFVDDTAEPSRPTAATTAPKSIPTRATKLAKLAVVAFVLGIGSGTLWWDYKHTVSPSAPTGEFVAVGHTYRSHLAMAYASAWDDGAKLLESGQPVAMALDTVKTSWESGRNEAFARYVSPEFSRVVPEGKNEKDITPEERQRLADAWRSFAKGLRK